MEEKQSKTKLYFSVFTVDLVFFSCGCIAGWTSPTLPKLQSPDSWLRITDAEAAWIVSFFPVGCIFGPIISGLLLDRIGRKATTLINVLLILLSWFLLVTATSVYIMYIARLAAGLGAGATFAVLPIYIAEVAEDSLRSAVNTVLLLFVSSGMLVAYGIGPYISYLQLVIVSAVPSIIFLILCPWLPESPYYLVYKNDVNKAVTNLRWFRGNISETHIEQEIKHIQLAVRDNASQKGTIKDVFTSVAGRKATFIVWGLFFWLQMNSYTFYIFIELFNIFTSPRVTLVIFSVLNVIMGAVSPPLIHHFGYKKMLIASAALMFVTYAVMSILMFLRVNKYDHSDYSLVVFFVMLAGCVVASGIGFSNIPWAIMGELYPTYLKAFGAGMSTCFFWICQMSAFGFVKSNIFHDFALLLGLEYVFGLCGLCCLLDIVFVIFIVPDTSGLSLVEIQELMNNQKSSESQREKKRSDLCTN